MFPLKIVPDWKSCPYCHTIVILPKYKDQDYYFYCHICLKWINWREETCLKNSKIHYEEFERLLLMFIHNKSASEATLNYQNSLSCSQSSKNTVQKYFKLFTDIAYIYYTQNLNSILLTGEVEVDETLIFKPKKTQAKGHGSYQLPLMWLLGMIERGTKRFIIIPVKTRDEPTLMNILLKYINCNATIYTDCHSVYVNNRIFPKESRLLDYGYNHQYVDHSKEFVTCEFDHIHTNTIERLWKSIKSDLRDKKVTKGYMKAIARFYFHKTLHKNDQLKFIMDYINK